tara:strand:- start:241 stop:912 length:672 start_codon:yes stop_codon:yes gene_type:complete
MHRRKGKKILIYFFLLILVGSINNSNINNIRFKDIKKINIIGLEEKENLILLKQINNLSLSNIFLEKGVQIENQINSNSLVEKYNIFKRYPDSLNINIEKTKFLAKINKGGQILFIGSNGKLSKNNFSDNKLPFIFGKPEIQEFLNFKRTIDESKFLYHDIKSLYFFPSKRWDLELNNNILIKLSENNVEESLNIVFDFLNDQNFKDIKTIDMRIKDQIILNG